MRPSLTVRGERAIAAGAPPGSVVLPAGLILISLLPWYPALSGPCREIAIGSAPGLASNGANVQILLIFAIAWAAAMLQTGRSAGQRPVAFLVLGGRATIRAALLTLAIGFTWLTGTAAGYAPPLVIASKALLIGWAIWLWLGWLRLGWQPNWLAHKAPGAVVLAGNGREGQAWAARLALVIGIQVAAGLGRHYLEGWPGGWSSAPAAAGLIACCRLLVALWLWREVSNIPVEEPETAAAARQALCRPQTSRLLYRSTAYHHQG